MEKTVCRIVCVVLLLVACGSAPVFANGGSAPVPICPPPGPCIAN